jgi:hypothetical protein
MDQDMQPQAKPRQESPAHDVARTLQAIAETPSEKARVKMELANAELDSFDRRWTHTTFRSKDHNRNELVSKLEDARLDFEYASRGQQRPNRAAITEAKPSGPSFQFAVGSITGHREQRGLVFLEVTNTGRAEAKNARGRLIAINLVGWPRKQTLDIPLAWEHPDGTNDLARKSFHGMARLFVAQTANPQYLLPVSAQPLSPIDLNRAQFRRDIDMEVGVEVSAEGLLPSIGWFKLHWHSDVRTRDKDGNEVIVLLDSQHFAVEVLPDQPMQSQPSAPNTEETPRQ